ncbi:hypothetical protein [Streptacidiphilus cavernicola]|uniref:Uncharacterized protein n=1 Tax=Streptacidiphilus cavernicola TaxID=3342716 RepID=A0ABV6W483_9ACTN
MTAPLSEERLAEIQSLHLGCWYSGEWIVKHPHGSTGPAQVVHVGGFGDTVLAELPDFAADIAVFFADAHEAVPELLAEVARLKAVLAAAGPADGVNDIPPEPPSRLSRVRVVPTNSGGWRVRHRLDGKRKSSCAFSTVDKADAWVEQLVQRNGGAL